jgi:hypothetical protein
MNMKVGFRALWAVLCAVFFALYIASKIDFFSRYNALGISGFIHGHRIY